MHSLGLAVLAALAFGAGDSTIPEKGDVVRGDLGRKIDEYLTRITPFGFSGAVLVSMKGEIVIDKGYGFADRSNKIPNTADTAFCTGSLTKQFTAAAILKLEMMGKLDIGDPISKFVDGVPPDKAKITLHHLLTLTAGVIDNTGRDYEEAPRDETVKKILAAPLAFEPGTEMRYSNAAYSLPAAIVEKASGQSYERFLHDQLFEPAGMKWTGYRIPKWDERVVARWHVGDRDNGTPLEKNFPQWNLLGNGGILSTTADMYRWHLALAGDAVLSAAAKKKLFTPARNDFACGWDSMESPHGHVVKMDGGSTLGSSAEFRRYVDADVCIVIFCNASFDGSPLTFDVREKITSLAFGESVDAPPATATTDSEKFQAFTGRYELPTGGSFDVALEAGSLRVRPTGADAIAALLFPKGVDVAIVADVTKRSQHAIEALLRHDPEPLAKELGAREKVNRFSDALRTFAADRSDTLDDETKVECLGLFPSRIPDFEFECRLRLVRPRGFIPFALAWRAGKLVGIGPVEGIRPFGVTMAPQGRDEWVAYHLAFATTTRLRLVRSGDALEMVFPTKAGDQRARKTS
ncbi:MAG: serine hydrolase [Planctomycetes bacterium]|nr:serine hydrolase [Planctomycetota bacterium]